LHYLYAYILCMYKDIHVCINIYTHLCPSSVHVYCAYTDKTISLIQRIHLFSGDFSFIKYHLNGFRNHKYIHFLFKELTDSIHSN